MSFAVQRSGQTEGIGDVACSERQQQQQRGAERKRGVRLSGRDGLPTHRPTLQFGFQISHVARNAAKLCAYLVGAGMPQTTEEKAQ